MLYLRQGQNNTITVTWSQRAKNNSAPYFILELVHIGTLDIFRFSFLKVNNQSNYPQRYDRFVVELPAFFQKGQYRYKAYESNTSSISGQVSVVETGLAQVEMEEMDVVRNNLTTNYAEYASTQLEYLADELGFILTDELGSLIINVGDAIPENTMADENDLPITDELNQFITT